VTYVPKRPGEPDCTWADVARLKAVLGWEPRVSFEQGVRHMLDAIDMWRTAPVWDPASIGEATRAWFAHLGRGNA
jgi:UDP-glucose 4-epimerase